MAAPNLVNVGNLVTFQEKVGIAVEVSPALQVAGVLEATSGRNGLQLALAGNVTEPVEVIGSIPLPEVADAQIRNEILAALGRDRVLSALCEASAQGPAEHPRSG